MKNKTKIRDVQIGGNTIFFFNSKGITIPQNQDSGAVSLEEREGDVTRVGNMGLGVDILFPNPGGRYMIVSFIIIL